MKILHYKSKNFRRKYLPLMLCVLISFVSGIADATTEAVIEGRVFTQAGPLSAATVFAYRSYDDLQKGQSPATQATTDLEGVYRFKLPLGSYFFAARGAQDGRQYYAYQGSNPIKIYDENLWVPLMSTEIEPPPLYTGTSAGIEGRITYKGQPVPGAHIAIYAPENRTFKGLGIKTESASSDGRFKIDIAPGRYVVTARKNGDGDSNRPPRKGDLFCYYSRNPVDVKPDKATIIELSCYPKIDRSTFVATPAVKTDDFQTIPERAANSKHGIRGSVTDSSGRPIAGLSVLAYPLTSPIFMMYNLYHGSEFSSETDAEGKFFIALHDDGDYGLVARDSLGDGPHKGEIYGIYQGNTRHAVSYKSGTLVDNISITAGRIMDSVPARNQSPAPIMVGSPGGAPVVISDTVISSDTIWQGKILISGVVSIKRGATLTIKPGTQVLFKRVDRDLNDVGDGEILVEGRLVAQGTAEKKIIFRSAEKKPAVNDWSYVQFLASDPDNIIEHCSFEHAFAGIMIHYADVRISDSLFRNNNRGLHYNTANLRVSHNTFKNNRIGIRFMRFEGDVRINENTISNNDIGILFVRQHVNAVDFDQLNRGDEKPDFKDNNITGNRTYNFSLGEGQERDIDVSGNWWGSARRKVVAASIFDRSKDGNLSRIIYTPLLNKPVKGAGVRGGLPKVKTKVIKP